jgi:hypothetical protein
MAALFSTAATVLNQEAKLNESGHIQKVQGVGHKPHKNFGG